ncbi:MAG: toll/interleukin-1 receptor domain-containing protein [Candidatus Tenebribacter burtonii]|nr:toll/interleukin-1 receptor domain-containing protein [Candidatus Tenebribacter burtonii]
MQKERKTVFISYSWDSHEHQKWVLELSTDLIKKYGIDVILDQFELSAGKDLTYFMEQSIEKADKVLIILTPNYKIKSEDRDGGVGYEYSMISQELFESPITNVKFIPIMRLGDLETSSPKFLKSKIYHQMGIDQNYPVKLFELSKIIYDEPLIEKPELGPIPDFEMGALDPIIDIANAIDKEERLNNEITAILESHEGVYAFGDEIKKLYETIENKVNIYNKSTHMNFSYETDKRSYSKIKVYQFTVHFRWSIPYSNSTRDSYLNISYSRLDIGDRNKAYLTVPLLRSIKENRYNLDINYEKTPIWKSKYKKSTTDDLISDAFLFLIEQIKKEKSKNFRE